MLTYREQSHSEHGAEVGNISAWSSPLDRFVTIFKMAASDAWSDCSETRATVLTR